MTNVRRRANSATGARVSVRAEGSGTNRTLVVGVTNTSLAIIESGIGEGRRGGGSGLVGLKERVGALGGTLNAGPFGENGRQVRASVPFSPAAPVS
ncbi:hypothetical protein ACIQRW_15265 [Streptomyces sp. NPDC091287]|uniref:hypothetical protein n=1 Tax=Streptomyces sp. NPDC091287 TaxID=3365988 RepID=UPI003803F935